MQEKVLVNCSSKESDGFPSRVSVLFEHSLAEIRASEVRTEKPYGRAACASCHKPHVLRLVRLLFFA